MEQSSKDEEECGICLDELTNPVALPCNHKFCSECLDGWRSKYGAKSGDKETNTKCPTQFKSWRITKSQLEAEGDISSENYRVL